MSLVARTLIVGASLALPLGGAMAATISYTQSFGPTTTDFQIAPLTLSGFASTLGILDSVNIDYGFTSNFSGAFTNTSGGTATFRITETVEPTFSFYGPASIAGDYYLSTSTGAKTFAGVANNTSRAFGPYSISDLGTIDPTALAEFINTDFSFAVATDTGLTVFGGGGNIVNNLVTTGQGYATVTYTYHEAPPSVPEPASWAMMLVGFGALGGVLRRNRRVAVNFG